MRKVVLALAAVASVGLIVPVINSARAEDRIVIRERGDHHHHHRWHRDHDRKVVVIKRKHRDHDRD
jgi:hypothetical protein